MFYWGVGEVTGIKAQQGPGRTLYLVLPGRNEQTVRIGCENQPQSNSVCIFRYRTTPSYSFTYKKKLQGGLIAP